MRDSCIKVHLCARTHNHGDRCTSWRSHQAVDTHARWPRLGRDKPPPGKGKTYSENKPICAYRACLLRAQCVSSECMAALGRDHKLLGGDHGEPVGLEPALLLCLVLENVDQGNLGRLLRCSVHRGDLLVLETGSEHHLNSIQKLRATKTELGSYQARCLRLPSLSVAAAHPEFGGCPAATPNFGS